MVERRNASALAVERAADILLLLAQEHDGLLSVSELARLTRSSGSAVHRILTALKRKDLVDQDPDTQRYFLSWRMLALSRQLRPRADLRKIAYPRMVHLRDVTSETVTLNVRSGTERVCIEQVEGIHEIRWIAEIGVLAPLHSGVTGVVLLAYSNETDRNSYLRSLNRFRRSDPSVPDRETLAKLLEQVVADGYALEHPRRVFGIDAVSAPVMGPDGQAVAALTIAGPGERCTADRLKSWVPVLLSMTNEISNLLTGSAESGSSVNQKTSA